jgi:hypothetical protein
VASKVPINLSILTDFHSGFSFGNPVKFHPQGKQTYIIPDNGTSTTIAEHAFLLEYLPDINIRTFPQAMTASGVTGDYVVKEWAFVNMYLIAVDPRSGEEILAQISHQVEVMDDMKSGSVEGHFNEAAMLLGLDVMRMHGMVLDAGRGRLVIRGCEDAEVTLRVWKYSHDQQVGEGRKRGYSVVQEDPDTWRSGIARGSKSVVEDESNAEDTEARMDLDDVDGDDAMTEQPDFTTDEVEADVPDSEVRNDSEWLLRWMPSVWTEYTLFRDGKKDRVCTIKGRRCLLCKDLPPYEFKDGLIRHWTGAHQDWTDLTTAVEDREKRKVLVMLSMR